MSNQAIKTFQVNGYTVEILPDLDPMNPWTEYDRLGEVWSWSCKRTFGDKEFSTNFYDDPEDEAFDAINALKRDKAVICFVQHRYDGGLEVVQDPTLELYSNSNKLGRTDGVIFATRAMIRKEFAHKIVTKADRDNTYKTLIAEVREYSDWATGNVYGYDISDPEGALIASCWGFIGDPGYCETEARAEAEALPTLITDDLASEDLQDAENY